MTGLGRIIVREESAEEGERAGRRGIEEEMAIRRESEQYVVM